MQGIDCGGGVRRLVGKMGGGRMLRGGLWIGAGTRLGRRGCGASDQDRLSGKPRKLRYFMTEPADMKGVP